MVFGIISLFYFIYKFNFNILKAFYAGCLFSFGQLFFGLYWIAYAFEYTSKGGVFTGFIAIIFLTFFMSIFTGVFCSLSIFLKGFWNLNIFGFSLVFASLLSFGEYLRGNLFGGFPWNIIGYVWSDSYVLMQPVSIVGIYGLGLFTFLASLSFILFFYKKKYGLYAISPLLILILIGAIRIIYFSDINDSSIAIRVVQPSIKQIEKLDNTLKSAHLKKLKNLSLKENINFSPSIIIWPESAFPYNSSILEKNFNIFNWLKDDQLLITGITRVNIKNKQLKNIFNSAYVISNSDKPDQYYDKVRLVPFGEFNPFKKFVNFGKITSGNLDFSKGKNSNIFKLSKVNSKVGFLICYEVIFSSQIINGPRPDFLINLTNDAWYGDTYGPVQHLAAAKARAIEEGISIIRSANTGISAIIDPYGRYIKYLELGKEGIIDIHIPKPNKKTLFSVLGNILFLIISIFMLMLARIIFISKKL